MQPHELTKPTPELISVDYPPPMFGNHNCDTWMWERGSHCSDVKSLRPNALPLSQNNCKLRLTRQAASPRKNEFVRRRRISTAAER
jgi:hypothetical protein